MNTRNLCTALVCCLGLTLAACDSGITPDIADGADALVQPDKIYVCHVGNTFGPNGETYLDDPTCEADCVDAGGTEEEIAACQAACPDAGKVDLLHVPDNSSHLGNDSHCFTFDGDTEETCDYTPDEELTDEYLASEEAKADDDGNGIDNACEMEEDDPTCPVFESTICSGELFGGPYSSTAGGNSNIQRDPDVAGSCEDIDEETTYYTFVLDVCENTCGGTLAIDCTVDPTNTVCKTGGSPSGVNQLFKLVCNIEA